MNMNGPKLVLVAVGLTLFGVGFAGLASAGPVNTNNPYLQGAGAPPAMPYYDSTYHLSSTRCRYIRDGGAISCPNFLYPDGGAPGGSSAGSGSAPLIGVWNGASTLTSYPQFAYDGGTLAVPMGVKLCLNPDTTGTKCDTYIQKVQDGQLNIVQDEFDGHLALNAGATNQTDVTGSMSITSALSVSSFSQLGTGSTDWLRVNGGSAGAFISTTTGGSNGDLTVNAKGTGSILFADGGMFWDGTNKRVVAGDLNSNFGALKLAGKPFTDTVPNGMGAQDSAMAMALDIKTAYNGSPLPNAGFVAGGAFQSADQTSAYYGAISWHKANNTNNDAASNVTISTRPTGAASGTVTTTAVTFNSDQSTTFAAQVNVPTNSKLDLDGATGNNFLRWNASNLDITSAGNINLNASVVGSSNINASGNITAGSGTSNYVTAGGSGKQAVIGGNGTIGAVWLGVAPGSITTSNYSLYGDASANTVVNVPTGGVISLRVNNASFAQFDVNGFGTITLSSGTGTHTVRSGCTPVCGVVGGTAHAVACAVSSTTLTATGTGTDVVSYMCF